MGRPRDNVPGWWLPAVAALVSAAVVATAAAVTSLAAPQPPSGLTGSVPALWERDGAVHVAGSGSWLPLARVLADDYARARPGAAPTVVHGSVGSGGGLRALADGVVDIALVAVAEDDPRRPPPGCRFVPVALSAVAVAVHPSVPDRDLSRSEAAAALTGRLATWSDGRVVVPLLREEGDSATDAAARALAGLAPALEAARVSGRYSTLLTDVEMGDALVATPGAVGLYDAAALVLEGRALGSVRLDGLAPTLRTLRDGSYPIRRRLLLAVPDRPRAEVRDLVDHVGSEAGRALVEASGYLPTGAGAR